jgi:GNAT superfamily N-acetyltransferase
VRVADKYDIIVKRDRTFLTWRFCNLSFRSYYILTARASGELVGYAVLRCTEIEEVRTGLIMDLLVEPSERGEEAGLLLVEKATRWFREAGMALAGSLMLRHTQEYEILHRAGYVDCPERFAPQAFRLTTTSLSPRVPNEFLAQADRWFVTMANHDAV